MAKQHYKSEQIISKLREAEVELGRGLSVPLVCKQLGITDSTYYRWQREYNTWRPHSGLGYRPPTPVTLQLSPGKNASALPTCRRSLLFMATVR